MATQSASAIKNSIVVATRSASQIQTSLADPIDTSLRLRSPVQSTTDVLTASPEAVFVQARSFDLSPQPPLPEAALQKKIAAVVEEVTPGSVVLICQLPNDRPTVRLPRDLVSDDLARYGTPVSIGVETIDGFRRPVVTPRPIAERQRTQEEAELAQWAQE